MKGHAVSRRTRSGFTLIEILVVLVIVSLISGVVMTGLAQVFSLRERLGPLIDQSDAAALIGSWYRKQVNGIMPDVKDGKYIFHGGPKQFTGLTNMPIGGDAGVPTPFSLMIVDLGDGTIALQTHNNDSKSDFNLVTWRQDEKGAEETGFQYFDGIDWSPIWPIPAKIGATRAPLNPGQITILEEPPQLPKLIRADIVAGGQRMILVAAPSGPERPIPRIQDFLR